MSYGLPRRGTGALEKSSGWADALGGILGTVGAFMQAKQANALQQQQLDRQKANDEALARSRGLQDALTRGQLTSHGLDDQGNLRPDPYIQQQQNAPGNALVQEAPTQGQPGDSDAALRQFTQAANPEDNLKQHVLALLGAGMVARAAPYQQQLTMQQQTNDRAAQAARQGVIDSQRDTNFNNQQTVFANTQADRTAAQAQTQRDQDAALAVTAYHQGWKLPKGFAGAPPQKQVGMLQDAYVDAINHNDMDLAKNIMTMQTGILGVLKNQTNNQTHITIAGMPGRSNGSGGAITAYQQAQLDHWDLTHNPDGTPKKGDTGTPKDVYKEADFLKNAWQNAGFSNPALRDIDKARAWAQGKYSPEAIALVFGRGRDGVTITQPPGVPATPAPASTGAPRAPKEGDRAPSKSGKPMIFRSGEWQYL